MTPDMYDELFGTRHEELLALTPLDGEEATR